MYGVISGTFDGRYVYFGPATGGRSIRFDTSGSETSAFSNSTSQSWQEVTLTGINPGAIMYEGVISTGRYIYYVPYNGATAKYFTRYDTQSGEQFSSSTALSWSFIDISASVLGGSSAVSYSGGAYDGRYIYLIPNGVSGLGSIVARYDTLSTENFSTATLASWAFFDLKILGGATATGYRGSVYDGRYLYFVPAGTSGIGLRSTIARYDTLSQETFSSPTSASWQFFNVGNLNSNAKGLWTGVFDGRYLYFLPWGHLSFLSTIARFDTQSGESFNSATTASWTFFDISTLTGNYNVAANGFFDGRYLYVIGVNGSPAGNYLLRYDTHAVENFSTATSVSWQTINLNLLTPGSSGNLGGTYDGRYLYLSPYNAGSPSGFTQYDTIKTSGAFSLSGATVISDGMSYAALGPSFQVNTPTGFYRLGISTPLTPQWHFVAGSYDGSQVSLYVDGSLASSKAANGTLLDSGTPVTLGSFYQSTVGLNGEIGLAQVYNRSLSSTEIQNLYTNQLCK